MSAFESREADWLSFEEALAHVLKRAREHASRRGDPIETLPFEHALGRAVAIDLKAPRALPEHDNSGMDGYAVFGADIEGSQESSPAVLDVVGESLPGAPWRGSLDRGQAVRIMTGAAVPAGADSVVRVEHTSADSDVVVRVHTGSDAYRNIRPAGEDMAAGDVVVVQGSTLSPGHVAVLTSTGHLSVPVVQRPRVALLSTGDELVSIGSLRAVEDRDARNRLWADRIVDSNTPTLLASVEEAGGDGTVVGIARDHPASLNEMLDRAHHADVLVTTGGASMGTHDLLKRVMDERGFEQDFWRVRIRPGSPVSLGFLPRDGAPALPVFGLPGNPTSSFVTFELFVRPYVRLLAGHASVHRPVLTMTAATELRGPKDLCAFLRVAIRRHGSAVSAQITGPQGSGLVSSLGLADGLAVLPEGIETIAQGEPVDVSLLRLP